VNRLFRNLQDSGRLGNGQEAFRQFRQVPMSLELASPEVDPQWNLGPAQNVETQLELGSSRIAAPYLAERRRVWVTRTRPRTIPLVTTALRAA
jgi:hypothetical protein